MESLLPSGQFILSEEDSLYNRNRQGKRRNTTIGTPWLFGVI